MIDKCYWGKLSGLRVFSDKNISSPELFDTLVFKDGCVVIEKVVAVPIGYDFGEMYSTKIQS